jgi:hypothetical protein
MSTYWTGRSFFNYVQAQLEEAELHSRAGGGERDGAKALHIPFEPESLSKPTIRPTDLTLKNKTKTHLNKPKTQTQIK